MRTTDKTVKRVLDRQAAGRPWLRRPRLLRRNIEAVAGVIAENVNDTEGRITAKRLLPVAQAARYQGSARNFRRAVGWSAVVSAIGAPGLHFHDLRIPAIRSRLLAGRACGT